MSALDAVVLVAASMGLGLFVRTLPGAVRLQGWLEGTWTRGKPLNCWVCLTGWSALALIGVRAALHPPADQLGWYWVLCEWLMCVGIGSTVLRHVWPILPASDAPTIDLDAPLGDHQDEADNS